ncbi:MAG: hypothetical protein JWL83_4802, partial [Actinomycetia bacterium]|nr:hypothetical protein [Actinomycetes bacterium]
ASIGDIICPLSTHAFTAGCGCRRECVDLVRFAKTLRECSADDIVMISADLVELIRSPAEEVLATRAVLTIEQSLRRVHRQPQAGLAAYAVAQAVLAAAEHAGIELPNDDVTRVGRSAATLARGVIAGAGAQRSVDFLAGGFRHALGLPLAA